jgi:RimJ/RimL family protein N-acetyltransferase
LNGTSIFIPSLKSPRLVLRALRVDDHPHLLEMAHDAEVTRHLNEGPPPSGAEVWRRMAFALGQWALRGYGMMAIDDAEGFVGRVGVHHPFDEPDPQLSYILCRRGWGKGYATESVGMLRDWMFDTHRPSRLVSQITPDNAASARVAQKLGAVLESRIDGGGVALDVWSYPPSSRGRGA